MKKLKLLTFLVILFPFISCNNKLHSPKADELKLVWQNIKNGIKDGYGLKVNLLIINNSKKTLLNNWELYFNVNNNPVSDSLSKVVIEHINGDFWKIKPKTDFFLQAGDTMLVAITCGGATISLTDAPSGFFIVSNKSRNNPQSINNFEIINLITSENLLRNPGDVLPAETPQLMYERYKSYGLSILTKNELLPIIPSPIYLVKKEGSITIEDNVMIGYNDAFMNEANFLREALVKVFRGNITTANHENDIENKIVLKKGPTKDSNISNEAYSLEVNKNKITITSNTSEGIFNGIQSLRCLIDPKYYKTQSRSIEIPCTVVKDAPLFTYRGIQIDVARNFQSKESILKLLDAMALYKLNRLHLHIANDEGWRLEIFTLPELTSVGAFRYYNPDDPNVLVPSFGSGPFKHNNPGNGYYTREDFIEILRYANARHIQVIPEIDMPGHARAAIKAMQVRYIRLMKEGKPEKAKEFLLSDLLDGSTYRSVQGWNDNVVCVGNESVYGFINEVVQNLKQMYTEARAPFTTLHTGGDEVPHGVWEKSPVCKDILKMHPQYKNYNDLQLYFIEHCWAVLKKNNLQMAGWEEIGLKNADGKTIANKEFAGKNYIPFAWNNVWGWGNEDVAYKLANVGYPVVLCNATNLYFDLAYCKNIEEPGQYWAGFTNTRTAFEFTPFNVLNCAYEDLYGNKINTKTLLKSMERLKDKGKSNILGMEGLLWSENIKTTDLQEYMMFPKLLGLAERAWAKQPSWASEENESKRLQLLNKQWNIFSNTLARREFYRLDYFNAGYNYRIAPPAAIRKDSILYVQTEFPGMLVRYTTDGTEPNNQSRVYYKPINVIGTIKLKTFSESGRYSRTSSIN